MITYLSNGSIHAAAGQEPTTVKIIEVNPGSRLSDQKHEHRQEHWTALTGGVIVQYQQGEDQAATELELSEGESVLIPKGAWHRLSCKSDRQEACQILEISTGHFDEDDIIRRSDDYGRVSS